MLPLPFSPASACVIIPFAIQLFAENAVGGVLVGVEDFFTETDKDDLCKGFVCRQEFLGFLQSNLRGAFQGKAVSALDGPNDGFVKIGMSLFD